jgi:hypothetical protein
VLTCHSMWRLLQPASSDAGVFLAIGEQTLVPVRPGRGATSVPPGEGKTTPPRRMTIEPDNFKSLWGVGIFLRTGKGVMRCEFA